MKRFLLPVLYLGTFCTGAAQSVSWNAPLSVASTTYNNTFPRLSLITGDRPLVTWGSPSKVYSAVWNGTAFSTPLTITPTGVTPYIQTWTGAESDAEGDTVFVTFGTSPINLGIVYTVRSVNGGLSYEDTVRVTGAGIGPGQARFPSVAITPGGNPVVQFLHMNASFADAEYSVARSLTAGANYLTEVNASAIAPGEVCDCCPGSISTSGNKHVALYRNAGSDIRTIYAACSYDGSATYTQNTEVDQSNWHYMTCPSSGPSGVIVGDSLIATWMSASKVYIGTMNINDQQVGFNRLLGTGISGAKNFPRITAKGDTVAVVWQGYVMGNYEVMMSTSVTGAAGIGVHIDTLTKNFTGAQTRPDVEINNGRVHVIYTDDNADDVKYLSGIMGGPIGMSENKKASTFQLVSAYFNHGNFYLVAESPNETNARIQVVSAAGTIAQTQNQVLQKGQHTYVIPVNAATGLHTIQVVNSTGEKRSIKLVVIK